MPTFICKTYVVYWFLNKTENIILYTQQVIVNNFNFILQTTENNNSFT